MPSDANDAAKLDPGFFAGRLLVQIESWEPDLFLGLSRPSVPVEYRFQGGLDYIRSIELQGRVIAPKAHRDRTIRIWISPFGPDMRFGSGEEDMDEIGRLYFQQERPDLSDLSAHLMLPEDALPFAVTCLSSAWKYLHIWTFDGDADQASIGRFSVSATVHKNLEPWITED